MKKLKSFLIPYKVIANLRPDVRFLILTFLICLVAICISAIDIGDHSRDIMLTLRTMFATLFGYIIENATSPSTYNDARNNSIAKKNIGFSLQEESSTHPLQNITTPSKTENTTEVTMNRAFEDPPIVKADDLMTFTIAKRIIVVGWALLTITLVLIIGEIMGVDEGNLSMVALRNTAYASIGFLISTSNKSIKFK